MMFLNEIRHAKLVGDLAKLSMPLDMAKRCASYGDHLPTLDKVLSGLVLRIEQRCFELCEAAHNRNETRRHDMEAFLRADLTVWSAFAGELTDRQIPNAFLPKTHRALATTLAAIEQHKITILTAMGMQEGSRLQ